MPGNVNAHITAKMVIASAARLIEVRHFWRKRKRIAEISVPACPIPTQNTKLVMSHAHPTGTLRRQTPLPSQNSHEKETRSRPTSGSDGRKKNHQPIGVGRSTASATTSVMAWKSGDRRMSVGRPATGLSRSSASVWAKAVPALSLKSGRLYYRPSRESSARHGARRTGEADLVQQRLEIGPRGGNAVENPRLVVPDPRVRVGKRANTCAGSEEPLPSLVHLGRERLEERRRFPRAQDPRDACRQLARFDDPRVHAVHADRSRVVRGVPGEPDASRAEAPGQAPLEQPQRRPVNLRRPRGEPRRARGDQLTEPFHRRFVC